MYNSCNHEKKNVRGEKPMNRLEKRTAKYIEVKPQSNTKKIVVAGAMGAFMLSQSGGNLAHAESNSSVKSVLEIEKSNSLLPFNFFNQPNVISENVDKKEKEEEEFKEPEKKLTQEEKLEAEIREKMDDVVADVTDKIIKEKEDEEASQKRMIEEVAKNLTKSVEGNKDLEGAQIEIKPDGDNISININLNKKTEEQKEKEKEVKNDSEKVKVEEDKPKLEIKEKVEKDTSLAVDPERDFGGQTYVQGTKLPVIAPLTQEQAKKLKDTMLRPIDMKQVKRISSPFGWRTYGGVREIHNGTDYSAPTGTPIYAALDGEVVQSGQAGGYGQWIVIAHEINGMKINTIYGHMNDGANLVKVGDKVKKGQKISTVGNNGSKTTGSHLHFSIASSNKGRNYYNYIDAVHAVDTATSNDYAYDGTKVKKVETKIASATDGKKRVVLDRSSKVDMSHIPDDVATKYPYLKDALKVAKASGWDPVMVYAQWSWETDYFTSNVLDKNNNLAGQTWYPGCGFEKGTPRPESEGGYYMKFKDAAEGYLDFIDGSKLYSKVSSFKTAEEQIAEIKRNGWAKDDEYVKNVNGRIKEVREELGKYLVIK